MLPVRTKEEQAVAIAHALDDMMILPGFGFRMGVDPLLGLVPVIGDALATLPWCLRVLLENALRTDLVDQCARLADVFRSRQLARVGS